MSQHRWTMSTQYKNTGRKWRCSVKNTVQLFWPTNPWPHPDARLKKTEEKAPRGYAYPSVICSPDELRDGEFRRDALFGAWFPCRPFSFRNRILLCSAHQDQCLTPGWDPNPVLLDLVWHLRIHICQTLVPDLLLLYECGIVRLLFFFFLITITNSVTIFFHFPQHCFCIMYNYVISIIINNNNADECNILWFSLWSLLERLWRLSTPRAWWEQIKS